MRVAIAKKLLSTVGGSEAQARALAAALRDRGHHVTLVGMRPAWRRPGIPEPATRHVIDGLTYVFVPARFGRLGAAIDGVLPTALPDAAALTRALDGAEVVHSLAREWVGPLERIARRLSAAFVETPLVHPGQAWSGDSRADVARYARDDAVLALTEWEAGWYRGRGARRVHVTGVGPILAPLPEVARDHATVLFVGRKEKYKGYDAIAAAAPLVWRERPDARFVAVGQRRFLASSPPRDPRWEERGVVSEAEKAAAYARATVFAMPSDHETFGHTYLEAWAAGCPVIAGDIPPLREIVRAGIDGVHARNEPRAIAAAILGLLRDPEGARRMGESGRRRAELWAWPLVAERTERAYEAATQRSASRSRLSEAESRPR
ncbi:MAG: glycosyltransferase family 4 protein [Chloroflexi bacterium]|nr:glycosyltransferase family 4 protein [Chloroflexota bacterium]